MTMTASEGPNKRRRREKASVKAQPWPPTWVLRLLDAVRHPSRLGRLDPPPDSER